MNEWSSLIDKFSLISKYVWFGDNKRERKRIFEFRHSLPEKINDFLRHYSQTKLSVDAAVPPQFLREMYFFYKDNAKEINVFFVNFGHIGENHLHFNFLPRSNDEHAKAEKMVALFIKKAVSLGGTVSAEHGIGKLKRKYLKMMYKEKEIKQMVDLKSYFDPKFLLGRHNIFNCDFNL